MNVWKLRKSPKSNVNLGAWKLGKMPRSAFPMSGRRAYTLGARWTWRVVTFDADQRSLRLLVAFRTDKEQYRATAGVANDGDTTIVASVEFHGTHPGWHVHYPSKPVADVPSGVMRAPWVRRRSCSSDRRFGLDGFGHEEKALGIAAAVFGFDGLDQEDRLI